MRQKYRGGYLVNLFKRDDYYTVLLFNCSVDESQVMKCELGYWHHPEEGVTSIQATDGRFYNIVGPQDGYNLLHINPEYELEIQ